MTKAQQIDAVNDAIRAKVYEIAEAYFAGVRGAPILALESQKRALKAKHQSILAA